MEQDVDGIELIVIDDGSTDGSAAIVAEEFPGARLVQTSNSGASQARNLGTRLARGNFIQYLDADDILAPGKLRRQLAALEESGADVAYGDWQRLTPGADGVYHLADVVARQLQGDAEIALFSHFWCPPAAYIFRKEIIERIGGWNENLPIIQDARFALDSALRGGSFVYCPGVAAFYRVHHCHSLSTRSHTAFWRDCYTNATEVEKWWREHDGLTAPRLAALLDAYGNVARSSFASNKALFEAAYSRLEQLNPRYVPSGPRTLALLTRLVGYRRAEALALRYRQGKAMLRATVARLARAPQATRL